MTTIATWNLHHMTRALKIPDGVPKVIEQVNRPTLVLAHKKTLAAQLYHEFRGFFPHNAVEYFVSYYDYYQPEAYLPTTDTYIEKEATINDELDKLRMSATRSLFERQDVIIVASVSCIYGLGSPEAYYGMLLMVEKGRPTAREAVLRLEDLAGGFLLGNASVLAIPVGFPIVKYLEHLFEFTAHESCGKCFPCRIGTARGYELLSNALAGGARTDSNLFSDLLDTMQAASLCALGGGLPLPVRNALRWFSDELDKYFRQ